MDMMQVGYYVNDSVDLSTDYMSCDVGVVGKYFCVSVLPFWGGVACVGLLIGSMYKCRFNMQKWLLYNIQLIKLKT